MSYVQFASEMFKPAWFSVEPPNTVSNLLNSCRPKHHGAAQAIAQSRRIKGLKFSKSSTPEALCSLSDSELDVGVFLVLCRVFIGKLLSIDGVITDEIIEGGMRNGFHSIYSHLT